MDFYYIPNGSNVVPLIASSSGQPFVDICISSTGFVYLYRETSPGGGVTSFVATTACIPNTWNKIIFKRKVDLTSFVVNGSESQTTKWFDINLSLGSTYIGNTRAITGIGYMSNFKMFVGTSEIPETYNDKKVLDLDFKPTRKSYLFKDNNNKCVIHPVNITQRDYQNSQYCCSFNGVDQYLQLGKNELLNFGNDDFIIHIRFKITEYLNSWQMILGNNINTTNTVDGYAYIAIQPNTTINPSALRVTGSYGSNNWYVVDANLKTPLNEIIDAKIVNINNNIKIYINGVDVTITGSGSTTTISNGFNFNANNNTYIGYNADNHKFKGTIYSVKVFRNTSDLTLLD